MEYKNIQELIKVVSDSKLTSFEIETEGIRIKMDKKEKQVIIEKNSIMATPIESVIKETLTSENIATSGVSADKLENNTASTIENSAKIMLDENIFVIKSPIVGTMYSSPSPESQNFVDVGSKVKKGDTLCILEAMKLMNEIESEVEGEIIEVLVSNEDMVEYGQPLFKILKK